MPYRGRFAPSPTGILHAGSLLTALASWVRARQCHGQWLLRVEDVDPPREIAGSAQAILAQLQHLGLAADAPPLFQSARHDAYTCALDTLKRRHLVFPCWCSRNDLASTGSRHLDGHCAASPDRSRAPAWRLRVPDETIVFDDILQGRQCQNLRDAIGDFVLYRADGLWAYQLACVVDDAAQGITEVVRGVDLIDSTPRQICLQRALDLPTPAYLHLPVVTDAAGHKLSKSRGDALASRQPAESILRRTLQYLLPAGVSPPADADVHALLDFAVARVNLQMLAGRHTLPETRPDR
ncbi:MAG TPA: tRNA glutamyl-Q(34) synthetase GluQRS [Rhodanobacteraceae bacterium]